MTFTNERDKENCEGVQGFLLAAGPREQTLLRKLRLERSETDKRPSPGIRDTPQPTANEALILHAEAMAGLLEELAERMHLLRYELWLLRAELAQEVAQ